MPRCECGIEEEYAQIVSLRLTPSKEIYTSALLRKHFPFLKSYSLLFILLRILHIGFSHLKQENNFEQHHVGQLWLICLVKDLEVKVLTSELEFLKHHI